MKKKIIITNIPAFYKIRLYNEVNKKVSLTVVFTDAIESDRNKDFVSGLMEFDYKILEGSVTQKISAALAIVRNRAVFLGGGAPPGHPCAGLAA